MSVGSLFRKVSPLVLGSRIPTRLRFSHPIVWNVSMLSVWIFVVRCHSDQKMLPVRQKVNYSNFNQIWTLAMDNTKNTQIKRKPKLTCGHKTGQELSFTIDYEMAAHSWQWGVSLPCTAFPISRILKREHFSTRSYLNRFRCSFCVQSKQVSVNSDNVNISVNINWFFSLPGCIFFYTASVILFTA